MIAPKPIVNAGVGEAIDQVAVTPLLADAVETEVTVPPELLSAAHIGLAPAPWVFKKLPEVPAGSLTQLLVAS